MTVSIDPNAVLLGLTDFLPVEPFMANQMVSDGVGNGSYLSRTEWNPAREAWVAGTFGRCLDKVCGPLELRMVDDQFPDFEMKVAARVFQFEVTMVTQPGRKMGKEAQQAEKALEEYKATQNPGVLPVKPYQPGLGEQMGPSWIAEAVARKARKGYQPQPHLLVYANFSANDLRTHDLQLCCQAYSNSFASLWVLHGKRCKLLYSSPDFSCRVGIWYR